MPDQVRTEPLRPAALWAGGAMLFGVAALVGMLAYACVEDDGIDATRWPVRDLLGLQPQVVEAMPAVERQVLAERLLQLAETQAVGDERASAVVGRPATRLEVTRALDDARASDAADPLLVQVLFREGDQVRAAVCPLTADDLAGRFEGLADWASVWPLAPELTEHRLVIDDEDRSEAEWLRARRAFLEGWSRRCAEAAGEPFPAPSIAARVTVERAAGAPFLLTWWAGEARVEVNPLVLWLWAAPAEVEAPRAGAHVASPSGAAPRLATAQYALDLGYDLESCTTSVATYCNQCDTQNKAVGNGTCSDPLVLSGSVWDNCTALHFQVPQGYTRVCVDRLFNQAGQARGLEVSNCMSRKELYETCGSLGYRSETVENLAARYQGFADPQTAMQCASAFDDCLRDPTPPAPKEDDGCGSWCEDSWDWFCGAYDYCCASN